MDDAETLQGLYIFRSARFRAASRNALFAEVDLSHAALTERFKDLVVSEVA